MSKILLKPRERILYQAKLHRFCYVFPFLLLGLGLMITFTPEFPPDPQSKYYTLHLTVVATIEAIKSYIPDWLLPYLTTFQALRSNYVGILLLVFGSARLINAFTTRNFARYWVTNKRVIVQTWIFSDHIQEIALERLDDVRVHYGYIGNLIGRGTVLVSDTGMKEIEIKNLSKPAHYKYVIMTAAEYCRPKESPRNDPPHPPTQRHRGPIPRRH